MVLPPPPGPHPAPDPPEPIPTSPAERSTATPSRWRLAPVSLGLRPLDTPTSPPARTSAGVRDDLHSRPPPRRPAVAFHTELNADYGATAGLTPRWGPCDVKDQKVRYETLTAALFLPTATSITGRRRCGLLRCRGDGSFNSARFSSAPASLFRSGRPSRTRSCWGGRARSTSTSSSARERSTPSSRFSGRRPCRGSGAPSWPRRTASSPSTRTRRATGLRSPSITRPDRAFPWDRPMSR